ncbi:MAG TPA: DUF5666 domain-containing protein [Candidatus Brocadiia bacterium]|nr:hypothetical protein [Planctomycetota bacterium]MDO8093486.1 DUF5666 domain-containing protein [Candidatus Brocadiales bacterium]
MNKILSSFRFVSQKAAGLRLRAEEKDFSFSLSFPQPSALFLLALLFFTTGAISINTAQADDGIKYYGTITSINYSKKTFVAGGRTFKTSNYTEIEADHGPHLTFCYLQIGHYVEVSGWERPTYVDAIEIEVKNYNGTGCQASGNITIKDNISLIDINASVIVVKNYTVSIRGSTKFKGTASDISGLYQGQLVKVKGLPQTDGTVKATLVKAR